MKRDDERALTVREQLGATFHDMIIRDDVVTEGSLMSVPGYAKEPIINPTRKP